MKKPIITTLLLFLPSCAVAAEQTYLTKESPALLGSSSVISFAYIVQLLFSLLIVLGFIYICAKFLLPRLQPGTKGTYIRVVDKVVLEPQVAVYIVKVENSAWLVAVSNKLVTKIDKLEGDFDSTK